METIFQRFQTMGEIFVVLSKTQPEIVDFTFYTDEETVDARVKDLNKLAKREEYWYITLFPSHRNSEEDGEGVTMTSGETDKNKIKE
jgi:lipid II:glycine glycyltransferase (peptidoglycan interpeptide bridge formation enzyme)